MRKKNIAINGLENTSHALPLFQHSDCRFNTILASFLPITFFREWKWCFQNKLYFDFFIPAIIQKKHCGYINVYTGIDISFITKNVVCK